MRFNVAYGTDIDKAMKVLRDAVIESDYSEPEWKNKDYGPVYFISYADSSLVLATTVYFKPVNATEIVMSDINKRVNDAFTREGIEIPFNYVNVVMKDKD
jgi:small conductance mechanosensitive channel